MAGIYAEVGDESYGPHAILQKNVDGCSYTYTIGHEWGMSDWRADICRDEDAVIIDSSEGSFRSVLTWFLTNCN